MRLPFWEDGRSGVPQKWASPRLTVAGTETLTGTLHYNDVLVAVGTMPYKHNLLDTEDTARAIAKTQVNLKLIPDVDGTPKIAQLVAYTLEDVHVKALGPGRPA